MKVPVLNMSGQEVDTVDLPADVFGAKVNRGLMHQAMVRQMANARRGTHQAKSRGQVNRTTAKVYRQKGTGNARHGSRRAPIFVGGGVAHGPKQRAYTKNMPRKMRRAALRSALTVKANSGDIVLLDDLSLPSPRTKEMAAVIASITGGQSALVLLPARDSNVELSARNLKDVKTLQAGYLNIRDLLGHRKLVMPLSALEAVTGHLSTGGAAASDEEE